MTKTVLITGTSTGIGLATAVAAAESGWHVVATMRDVSKAERLLKAVTDAGVADRVDVRALDVTDDASIASCVAAVVAERGGLDAVVNNAGAAFVGTIEQHAMDALRSTMEVNFFGVVAVTRAALPHLRASQGHVITVTSVGGVIGQPFNEGYCAAKFAVEGFMESLAPVAGTAGVRVSVVEPGAVASEFVANLQLDVPAMLEAAGPYSPALQAYLARTQQAFGNAQSATDAAVSIVDTLNAESPAFRVQTSDWAKGFVGMKLADLDGSAIQDFTAGWVR